MKGRVLFSFIAAAAPCLGFAQTDDMYFIPGKEAKTQEVRRTEPQSVAGTAHRNTAREVYAGGSTRDVDEYNRRYQWTNDSISADSGDIRDSDEEDYACSRRIIRFNAPVIGVAVSSPLYWDLRYGPASFYWDVYDDGLYAYAFPSDWYWWPSSFWGWGLYHLHGWGWYGGWYDPWLWGAHWHHPHWGYPGPGWHSPRRVARPSVRYREGSLLARGGASRAEARNRYSTGRAVRAADSNARTRTSRGTTRYTPHRSSNTATTRQASRTQSTSTSRGSTRSARSSDFTRSSGSRSIFRPSTSSHGRSGGGFSPSRGGGARGGRR